MHARNAFCQCVSTLQTTIFCCRKLKCYRSYRCKMVLYVACLGFGVVNLSVASLNTIGGTARQSEKTTTIFHHAYSIGIALTTRTASWILKMLRAPTCLQISCQRTWICFLDVQRRLQGVRPPKKGQVVRWDQPGLELLSGSLVEPLLQASDGVQDGGEWENKEIYGTLLWTSWRKEE